MVTAAGPSSSSTVRQPMNLPLFEQLLGVAWKRHVIGGRHYLRALWTVTKVRRAASQRFAAWRCRLREMWSRPSP